MDRPIKLRLPLESGLTVEAEFTTVELATAFLRAWGQAPASGLLGALGVPPHLGVEMEAHGITLTRVPTGYPSISFPLSGVSPGVYGATGPMIGTSGAYGAPMIAATVPDLRRWTAKLADRFLMDLTRSAAQLVRVLLQEWPRSLLIEDLVDAGVARSGRGLGPILASVARASDSLGARRPIVSEHSNGRERYTLHPEFFQVLSEAYQEPKALFEALKGGP